jgi:hypothetical protein
VSKKAQLECQRAAVQFQRANGTCSITIIIIIIIVVVVVII